MMIESEAWRRGRVVCVSGVSLAWCGEGVGVGVGEWGACAADVPLARRGDVHGRGVAGDCWPRPSVGVGKQISRAG